MILSFFRKAVTTGQVAVVGDVQTQRLDHRGPSLEVVDIGLVVVLGKKLPGSLQLADLPVASAASSFDTPCFAAISAISSSFSLSLYSAIIS